MPSHLAANANIVGYDEIVIMEKTRDFRLLFKARGLLEIEVERESSVDLSALLALW